ncbi:MAG: hydroxymethylglutaryl-CoA lyase [Pontibacterium sp.]
MSSSFYAPIKIIEVGPRDGLQNEPPPYFNQDEKLKLINLLINAGLKNIEVASFVSPKRVPQMANSADLVRALPKNNGINFRALVPNQRGLETAIACDINEVAVFSAASNAFCQNNIGCSIKASLERYKPVVAQANAAGLPVRGYVSTITHCPLSGETKPDDVRWVIEELLAMGCYEVALGDTTGETSPQTLTRLLDKLRSYFPAAKLSGHFHDTYNNALSNVEVAMSFGLTTFDSSIGGLGGCPYAPGAKGNLATEKLVQLLANKGRLDPDISTQALANASYWLQQRNQQKSRVR